MEAYFTADSARIILFIIILSLFSLPFLFGRKKEREGYYCFRRAVMFEIVFIVFWGAISALVIAFVFFAPETLPTVSLEPPPGGRAGTGLLLLALTLSFTLYGFHLLYRTPDKMGFDPEGNLVLKNLFYNKRIPPGKVYSLTIRSHGWSKACLLGYEGGKGFLPGNFDGMIEFVNRLKEANPNIKTKGL